MGMTKCCIYTGKSSAEINLDGRLMITSHMCGIPGQSVDFLLLTKTGSQVVLSQISPEIDIRFCHCGLQKDTLVLDDDFALQIAYGGVLAEVCIVLSGAEDGSRCTNLRTTTKLPFCVPVVCVYPFYASVLGILEANGCAREWMVSHYLLPWCRKDADIVPYWADFKSGEEENVSRWCPLLDVEILSREAVREGYRSAIDAFRHFISQNKYAYISYNAYYVDEFWSKGEHRHPYKHQCLVIGYDEERESMLIVDFFCGRFKTVEVSYEKFLMAYDTYDQLNNMPRTGRLDGQADAEYVEELGERELEYGHEIKLLSLRDAPPEIDLCLMYGLAKDFLNGTDTVVRHECLDRDRDKMSFGVAFLRDIRSYIQKNMEKGWNINLKPLYIIQSFSRVMKIRAEMLGIDDQAFLKEIEEALTCSSMILGIVMRYNMTGRGDSPRILERFDRLAALEIHMVEGLCDILEKDVVPRKSV